MGAFLNLAWELLSSKYSLSLIILANVLVTSWTCVKKVAG